MSGIAGFIQFNGTTVDAGAAKRMTASMQYRGLDGIQLWQGQGAGLGFCRTTTTVEGQDETQPLASKCGRYLLVLDGRLEERASLSRRLGLGVRESDVSLALTAWQHWGSQAPNHLSGDFALVVLDTLSREVFCARDPGCARQLHYYYGRGVFVFATDVHAILASGLVPEELNLGLVAEYLSGEWFSNTETFFKGILRLQPGESLSVSSTGLGRKVYWQPQRRSLSRLSFDDTVDQYKELLGRKVEEAIRSSHPVAAEVSGGLDSSALYAMALDLDGRGKAACPAIKAYSLGFAAELEFEDEPYVAALERYTGADIRRVTVSILPPDWFREHARRHRCHPGYPNITMSLGMYRAMAADGCRCVIGGLGGDQWLGGEWLEDPALYAPELRRGSFGMMAARLTLERHSYGRYRPIARMLRIALADLLPVPVRERLRGLLGHRSELAVEWLSSEMSNLLRERRAEAREGQQEEGGNGEGQYHALLRQCYTDPWQRLAFEQAERIVAEAGLELRHPYWSREIIQWAFDTPAEYMLRGGHSRYVHRRAMAGLLPRDILERRSKAEFSLATDPQLATLSASEFESIGHRRPGWVSQKGVAGLQRSYLDGRQDLCYDDLLWDLFAMDALAPEESSQY